MQKTFSLNQNKLRVNHEPLNDAEEFARICAELCRSQEQELIIEFAKEVGSLSSLYFGILFSVAVKADYDHKKLKIICSASLSRMFTMLGARNLMDYVEVKGE